VVKPHPRIGLLLHILLAIGVIWPTHLGAHELRPAIATFEFSDSPTIALTISLNLEAAIAGIGAGHEDTASSPDALKYDRLRSLEPLELRAEFERFRTRFLDQVHLRLGDTPVDLQGLTVEVPPVGDTTLARVSQVHLTLPAPVGTQAMYWRLNRQLGDSVLRLSNSATGEITSAEFIIAGESSGPLTVEGLQAESWTEVLTKFLQVGVLHIVPRGLDHILFVIGLFLLSTRVSALLWQITAFTAAHTATLALAMAGTILVSPAVVEPLIAASIVYVAVENTLTSRLHTWRPVVVFFFGLIHGLGFASVLQEIGPASGHFTLSLLAFNLGVELGQLTIIAACFVCLGWAAGRDWYRPYIVIPGSLFIGLMGIIWFVERSGSLIL
jgi:hypothetical protein